MKQNEWDAHLRHVQQLIIMGILFPQYGHVQDRKLDDIHEAVRDVLQYVGQEIMPSPDIDDEPVADAELEDRVIVSSSEIAGGIAETRERRVAAMREAGMSRYSIEFMVAKLGRITLVADSEDDAKKQLLDHDVRVLEQLSFFEHVEVASVSKED